MFGLGSLTLGVCMGVGWGGDVGSGYICVGVGGVYMCVCMYAIMYAGVYGSQQLT